VRSKRLPVEEILSILAATPPRLAALSAGLPAALLHTPPEAGAWSANDNLAHIRACNVVWGSRMLVILTQDGPVFKGIDPRSWIKKTDYLQQEFQPALRAFTTERAELLAVLEALPPEDWLRTGTLIDMVGKRLEQTALGYADALARHERSHLKQIECIVDTMRLAGAGGKPIV
jgi:hypothetical protein